MLNMLLSKLLRCPPAPHPADCACDTCEADVDDDMAGCGWFESSHDLSRGLRVTEHALDDATTVVLLALS